MADSEMGDLEMADLEMADSEMADSEMGDLEMADLEMADSEMADSEMADSEMTNPENPFHLLLAHSESYLEFEQKLLSLDDEKLQSSCFGQFINTLFNVLPNHQSYHQLADLPPEQQEMVDSLDGTVGLHGVLKKKLENQYCLVQVVFRSRVSEPIPKKKIHPLLFKRPSLSLGSVLVTNTLEITGSIKSRNFQLFNRDQLVINAFKFWNQIKKFGLKDKKWVVYHPTKLIPPGHQFYELYPQIRQICRSLADIYAPLLNDGTVQQGFHLYGYDLIPDAEGHVYLLEVNRHPAIYYDQLRQEKMHKNLELEMFEGWMELVFQPILRGQLSNGNRSWERIF